MFAGHIGVGMAIGRAERRVNVGVFVAAALLLDLVLWPFILLDWESVSIPADVATTHQPHFIFPYSHSVVAAVAWSAVAGLVAFLSRVPATEARRRAAALVATAVFSHWVLDALVHRPEMPLAGSTSAAVGLALWNNMPAALGVEAAVVAFGAYLFHSGNRLAGSRSLALVVLSLIVLAFTAIGMTVAPPPPSGEAMAVSSLVTVLAVCALVAWLGRLRTR
jgi:hypothetical protein